MRLTLTGVTITIQLKGDRTEADLEYDGTHHYLYGLNYAGALYKVGAWLQAKAFTLVNESGEDERIQGHEDLDVEC
jgi:hypothetical protein